MSALRQWVPAPITSVLVFLMWLMVNQSVSVGNLLIAGFLALILPLATHRFRGEQVHIKAWGTVVRLGLIVLYDIVLSNIELARRILGSESKLQPSFVWLPIDLTDKHAIVALAGIITMTPGTLSCDISDDGRHLLIHAFNVDDKAALVAAIKQRYESPLREIFE